jgi:hypothetical protein
MLDQRARAAPSGSVAVASLPQAIATSDGTARFPC